jgi:hypothetical protein
VQALLQVLDVRRVLVLVRPLVLPLGLCALLQLLYLPQR